MKHHKLFFAIIFSFLLPFSVASQVQQGYVKTRGRLGNDGAVIPGEGIENVTVKVKNEGTVISDNSGRFEIALRNEKYYLEDVTKKGYLLVDADILSKQYTRSVDTFKIVLTTPEHQLEDELSSERKLRRTLTRQLQQREDEIEELYETSKIIKAERDSALRKLYADHADNEKLIKDMVERYSRIDYDQLDDFNRRISEYILNGELQKADSLLCSKGDIPARIKQLHAREQLNKEERAELAEREKTLARSEELTRKELDDLASDCYNKFELFKLQHLNDSAAYYIELRASLDTTNVEWQMEYAYFIYSYFAKYNDAIRICNNVLNHLVGLYDADEIYVANVYKSLAQIYYSKGDFPKATELNNKSIAIYFNILGESHPDIVECYMNLAQIHNSQGESLKALELNNKSLEICLSIYDENHSTTATIYNNMALAYCALAEYDKALELFEKSQLIYSEIYGDNHPYIGTCYSNIGTIYYYKSDYSKALELFNKSLAVDNSIYGEKHPNIALNYNNIASVLYAQHEYTKAIQCMYKAYDIMVDFLPSDHPDILLIQQNIELVKSKIADQ